MNQAIILALIALVEEAIKIYPSLAAELKMSA